ncbi:MAG: tetratricopeptide repeat protein, partial [Flavobacteriales bacterium]
MAQDQRLIDSLQGALKNTGYDTSRVKTLLHFGSAFRSSKPKSAMLYAEDALKLAKSLNDKKSISRCLNFIGLLYDDIGDYQKAIDYYKQSLNIRIEINDKKGMASCYNNLGVLYLNNNGDAKAALDYYFKAMRLYEEVKYDKGLSKSLNNIGVLYKNKGDYTKALEFYMKAQKILVRLNDSKAIARNLSNIGNIYYAEEFFDKALESYKKSLKIRETLNDKGGIANCENNIAAIYYHRGKINEALEHSLRAQRIYEEIGNSVAIARGLNNIGSLYTRLGDYAKAEEYCIKSLDLSHENKNREGVQDAYHGLTELYESKGEYAKALEMYRRYSMEKDSVSAAKNKANVAEVVAEHENEKKQKAIELLKKEKDIQEIKLARNRVLIYAISIGFALLLILALVVLRGYRQKRRANQRLENQNLEISKQKSLIEEKNKDITDSIEYARRIQYAVLPPVESISRYLADYFIFFLPRDIVSGDFYWVEKVGDKIFIAAVDCTGHGVPGAFMSFLGYNHLNTAVREEGLTHPSEILDSLHEAVRDTLHQRSVKSDVHDGMDVALCA